MRSSGATRGISTKSLTISLDINLTISHKEAEVRVQDYREAGGLYDAIVSVEMIEAVGEAYWPAYSPTPRPASAAATSASASSR